MTRQSQSLSEWLKRTCQRRGLSLRQAATITGLSHSTINGIMNGTKAEPETIRKLAHGFSEDHHESLALQDSLLVLAGYRVERPDEELSQPLARLMDSVKQFNGQQLELMAQFARFLGQIKEKE